MRPETRRAHYQTRAEPLSLEDRLERARARARLAPAVDEPTLPTGPLVPVVTLTTDQLHDLIYAASSQYLRTLSGMPLDRARHHAGGETPGRCWVAVGYTCPEDGALRVTECAGVPS